jgi:hypothetical protein
MCCKKISEKIKQTLLNCKIIGKERKEKNLFGKISRL